MKKLKNEQKRCGSHAPGAYDLTKDIGKEVNNYNPVCMSSKEGDVQGPLEAQRWESPTLAKGRPSVKIRLNIDNL